MAQIKSIYDNEFVDGFARENMITKPTKAEVGQMLVVKAVDENGVPTEWEVSSKLQDTKVDKTGITLGQHTDGLIYIFIDGKPVGAGFNVGTGGSDNGGNGDSGDNGGNDSGAEVKIATITINENFDMPKIGDTVQLAWTITPDNATNKTLAFESSDNNVLTVNTDGLVTAIESGFADVTAIATDGSNAYHTITINVLDETALNSIPTSYHTAINTAVESVENEENVYVLFADTHFVNTTNVRHTFDIINYLAENTNCKGIIGMGDLINTGGEVEAYENMADKLRGNRSKLILIDGNHEWYSQTIETAKARYNAIKPSESWCWEKNCGYGYRVDEKNSTIIFAMNNYDNVGAFYDRGNILGGGAWISTKQQYDLMKLLCDYPEYKVVLCSHLCMDTSANLSMGAVEKTNKYFIHPLLKTHGNTVMFAGHLHGSIDGSNAPVPMWVIENDNEGYYDISKHDWSADTVNRWFNNAIPPFTDENGTNQAITLIKILDDKVIGYGIGKQPSFELNFIKNNNKTMVHETYMDMNEHSSIGNNIIKTVDENNVLSLTGKGQSIGQWITYKICDVPPNKTYAFAVKYKCIDTDGVYSDAGFTKTTNGYTGNVNGDGYMYAYGVYQNTGSSVETVKKEMKVKGETTGTVQISDFEYCYADITE